MFLAFLLLPTGFCHNYDVRYMSHGFFSTAKIIIIGHELLDTYRVDITCLLFLYYLLYCHNMILARCVCTQHTIHHIDYPKNSYTHLY